MDLDEVMFEWKTFTKQQLKDGQLMLSSAMVCHTFDFNPNLYDQARMKAEGQLALDAPENVFPMGAGLKIGDPDANCPVLVRTELSQVARRLMWASNKTDKVRVLKFFGPAGTGKTETAKDWARLAGYHTIVINCSDQFTLEMVKTILSEQVTKDSVVIFDECNRISLEQITSIMEYFKSLTEDKVRLIVLTQNPGYAGRCQLPDDGSISEKLPFTVPDYSLIIDVHLASEGFVNNMSGERSIAIYITTIFDSLQKQTSKKSFYDFGLRKILSVIKTAGRVFRESPSKGEAWAV